MSKTVEVSIETLERLLYASSSLAKIEGLLAGARQDPFMPENGAIGQAFADADRLIRHAKRAAENYAGWNDPLTQDEIATLLTLAKSESDSGTWTVGADDYTGRNLKPGQANTIQGLARRGMIEAGVPCKGVKWGNSNVIPWVADPFHFVIRITPRGVTAANLVNAEKGKS